MGTWQWRPRRKVQRAVLWQAVRWQMRQFKGKSRNGNSLSIVRDLTSRFDERLDFDYLSGLPASIFLFRDGNGVIFEEDQKLFPLSLRCIFRGREDCFVGCSPRITLDEASYLVLNDSESSARILEGTPDVESLTIFFGLEFASEVFSPLLSENDLLQFDSSSKNRLPIQFCQRLRPNDHIVSPRLLLLRSMIQESEVSAGLVLDELKVILQRLLHVHRSDVFEAESMPFRRASTRFQMYDRLQRSRDYISSSVDESWSLADMAKTADLSPYHFQRCFTRMFGISPNQYLTDCRLQKASQLLRVSRKSVTEICGDVGFESLGSFSSSFSQRFGLSPNHFRQSVVQGESGK